jgi:hypothetical protein
MSFAGRVRQHTGGAVRHIRLVLLGTIVDVRRWLSAFLRYGLSWIHPDARPVSRQRPGGEIDRRCVHHWTVHGDGQSPTMQVESVVRLTPEETSDLPGGQRALRAPPGDLQTDRPSISRRSRSTPMVSGDRLSMSNWSHLHEQSTYTHQVHYWPPPSKRGTRVHVLSCSTWIGSGSESFDSTPAAISPGSCREKRSK